MKELRKYNVYGRVVGSKYLGSVEAFSLEEAQELADNLPSHISLCHQCSSQIEDPEISKTTIEETLWARQERRWRTK